MTIDLEKYRNLCELKTPKILQKGPQPKLRSNGPQPLLKHDIKLEVQIYIYIYIYIYMGALRKSIWSIK